MKTRTLLLLSVGTALMILLAGGVLFFQLANQETSSTSTPIGETARVGDASIVVFGSDVVDDVVRVDIEISGVDDVEWFDSFRLVTGDKRLAPEPTGAEGRCRTLTVAAQRCTVDFDVSDTEGSNRVLVVRRGEQQATWRLV